MLHEMAQTRFMMDESFCKNIHENLNLLNMDLHYREKRAQRTPF